MIEAKTVKEINTVIGRWVNNAGINKFLQLVT
jgi:hypothetical protein